MTKEVKRMPFDGIVTRAIVEELVEKLVGGRIDKIYEPTNNELVFTIRNNRTNYSLLISIHPSYARIHLTETEIVNPPEPPLFCMVLRKHLIGSRIEKIEQIDLERIITIDLRGKDEIGDTIEHQLIVEIMGKHSNVMLIEKESKKIVNAMKHVPPAINRFRTILPGSTYVFPPSQNKLNIFEATDEQFIRKLDFNAGKLERQIIGILMGFSPFIAKELVHRSHLGSQETYAKQFIKLQQQLIERNYEFAIYENEREDFHVLPISYVANTKSFTNANELTDAFYANKAERDRVKQQVRDLTKFLQNEINKNKRKLKIHEQTLKEAEKAEQFQKYGELITANMHLVNKGMKNIQVIDYYDPEQNELSIPIKENLSPSENAQRYFSKYRKLIHAKERAAEEIEKTNNELTYLESVLQQLEDAREEDVEEIRMELEEEGYQKQRQKRKKIVKPKPEQYLSSDGTIIFVGRNNKQNEYVTHKLAHKEDIWLHTLNIPGSHVIIKSHNPSEETLLEAAQLAAYYSKARQSESVPVDFTKVKYVKKPSGAKPGFVTYTEQKTLFVKPKKLAKKIDFK